MNMVMFCSHCLKRNCNYFKLSAILGLLMVVSQLTHAETILRLHGSNTIGAKLGPALAEYYLTRQLKASEVKYIAGQQPQEGLVRGTLKDNSTVEIEIHAHGSSTSFRSLNAGVADIGMSSRPIKQKEVEALKQLADFSDIENEYVVGLDGIAVIVPQNNKVQYLTKKQLTDIFSGKITHWRQLGIKLGKINVYARDNNSGTYDTFKNLVLSKKNPLLGSARRYESNTELSDDVAKDNNAIGFVGLPYIRHSRAIPISDGGSKARFPSEFNVVTEDYALSRRLFLYAAKDAQNPHVRPFLNFAMSESGQEVVRHTGFVSQNPYATQVAIGKNYPDEYRELIDNAKRLSVNFRFKQDSLKLDSRAQRDLKRVAEFIKQQKDLKKVMLFGFSEDTNIPIFDISLSETRADLVERALRKHGITTHHVRGYGYFDPVAVNEFKEKNRRVEVWVR